MEGELGKRSMEQRMSALWQVGRRRWPVLVLAASTMAVLVLVSAGSYNPELYTPVKEAAGKLKDHVTGNNKGSNLQTAPDVTFPLSRERYDAAANQTLGFESIQFINMAHRFDRFDALAIQCYLSDLIVQTKPGFPKEKAGSEMVGFPPTKSPARNGPSEVASWRAHANIWQEMLFKRTPSVLILESDAVWDTQIRRIMGNLNRPFLDLLRSENPKADIVANADDPWAARSGLWDIISLGHCSDFWREGTGFRLYDDEFAPRSGGHTWFERPLDGKRVVYRAAGMVCVSSYVLSLTGAAKLLVRTAMNLDEPVDLLIDNMLKRQEDLNVYNVMRQPMAQWVYSSGLGMESRGANSDIRPNGTESSQSGDSGGNDGWPAAQKKGSVWEVKPQYDGVDFPDFGLGHAWEKVAKSTKMPHFY